jgi:hypothetical protein
MPDDDELMVSLLPAPPAAAAHSASKRDYPRVIKATLPWEVDTYVKHEPEVIAAVRCRGKLHRVAVINGSLVALNHTREELDVEAMLHDVSESDDRNACRCLEVLRAWRDYRLVSKHQSASLLLPAPLLAHRDRCWQPWNTMLRRDRPGRTLENKRPHREQRDRMYVREEVILTAVARPFNTPAVLELLRQKVNRRIEHVAVRNMDVLVRGNGHNLYNSTMTFGLPIRAWLKTVHHYKLPPIIGNWLLYWAEPVGNSYICLGETLHSDMSSYNHQEWTARRGSVILEPGSDGWQARPAYDTADLKMEFSDLVKRLPNNKQST